MSTLTFDPGQNAFPTNLAYGRYLDCLKRAVEVIVEYIPYANGPVTEFAIRDSNGQVLSHCIVELKGNPMGLAPNQPQSYTPGPGGAAAPPAGIGESAAAGLITGFRFGEQDASGDLLAHFKVRGIDPVSAAEFLSILTDTSGGYERLVGLLDDGTTVKGSAMSDRIEVGAGDDVIRARGGDDFAFKWAPGDLTYFGGAGRDTLYLAPDGDTAPPVFTRAMVLNLGTGLGKTAFGGDMVLKSVEAIHTGASDDRITGSKGADEIHDVYGGADVFRTKGGADLVTLFSNYQNTVYNGGAGFDRLEIVTSGFGGWTPERGYGVQRLHLGDASKNLEDFAGLQLSNVEDVRIGMVQDYIHLTLIGTGADERFEVSNGAYITNSLVKVRGQGGDDTITGSFGADRLFGGKGRDSLFGRDGDDRLFGDGWADVLDGGRGDDRLTGGAGPDTFAFSTLGYGAGLGHDTVTDFTDGQDLLDFSGHADVTRFKQLTITNFAEGARIDDGHGGLVDLLGVDADDLTGADFLF